MSFLHCEYNLTVGIILYRRTLTIGKKALNPIYQITKDGNTKNFVKQKYNTSR